VLLRTRPAASHSRSALSSTLSPTARRLAAFATPERLALGRTGAGAVMVLRPRALPQALGVDSATATRVGWVVQMLGAREIALGLGTLAALRSTGRRASRSWVAAGVLADGIDALAVTGALARGRISKGGGSAVLGVALAAVALGARGLQEDDLQD